MNFPQIVLAEFTHSFLLDLYPNIETVSTAVKNRFPGCYVDPAWPTRTLSSDVLAEFYDELLAMIPIDRKRFDELGDRPGRAHPAELRALDRMWMVLEDHKYVTLETWIKQCCGLDALRFVGPPLTMDIMDRLVQKSLHRRPS